MKNSVLIMSNHPGLRERVAEMYERAGYQPIAADLAPVNRGQLHNWNPDLVVIAPAEQSDNWIATCHSVRSSSAIPLLVASPKHDDLDELNTLAAGADDYIPRDRSARAILARSERLIQRRRLQDQPEAVIQAGGLTVNTDTRTLQWQRTEIPVTRTEFELVRLLCLNSHRVVPRSELIHCVWGEWYGDDHILEVHISRLRRKLQQAGAMTALDPIRGVGYRLTERQSHEPPL